MRFALLIVGVCLLLGCAARAYDPGTHYFRWAGLYTEPSRPTDSITKQQADALEADGKAYYVAEYDARGRLVVLEKRYQQRIEIRTQCEWSSGEAKCVSKRMSP